MRKFWIGITFVMMLSILIAGCGKDITNGGTTSGSLYSTSVPLGADIYLDGSYRGLTPLAIQNVSIGSHSV
jgi:hypothetical protein